MNTSNLANRIKEIIGLPPKSVIFSQLVKELPEENEDQICQALDLLYQNKQIDVVNGWIMGIRTIDTSRWINDDWEWINGTGRFGQ